jgi:hypothetical protein
MKGVGFLPRVLSLVEEEKTARYHRVAISLRVHAETKVACRHTLHERV